MKVVYVDVLFVLNCVVNFLILSLTSRLSGIVIRPLKLLLGAALGGIFSVVLFFAPSGYFFSALYKILLCAAVIACSFGKRTFNDFLRLTLIFCFISFAMGGIVFAASIAGLFGGGHMNNGVVYLNISLGKLFTSGFITYGLLSLIMGRGGIPKAHEIVEISAELNDKMIVFSAMIDTGNCLTEPITKKQIIMVSPSILDGVIPKDLLEISDIGVFAVPCRTASGTDLIYAFPAQNLKINNINTENFLIGLSNLEINGKQGTKAVCPPFESEKHGGTA